MGKSHVISLIRNDTIKFFRLSGYVQPDDVVVLLTAPTGVAAFNIQGVTLHSTLLLTTSKFTSQALLSQDELNTLRTRLANLNEISMVGSNMLLQIHRRLQRLKGSPHSSTFGNISILAVGDLFQLQPVAQPYVFDEVNDAYARLHGSGSLWMDEFSLIELDQIVRQKGDQSFAQLLCRVRKAECTDVDLDTLKAREIEDGALDYPQDALYVYRLNKDVDQHNMTKLHNLTSLHELVTITAIDHTKDKHTRQLDTTLPKNKADTGVW